MEEDEIMEQLPNLECAQWLFLLSVEEAPRKKEEVLEKLMTKIKEDNMLPFYLHVCEELKWTPDQKLVDKMTTANKEKLEQLEANLKDALENLGESEVREAMLAKSNFYTRIGDKVMDSLENALSQFRLTEEQTVGSGQKLDLVFTVIRLGLFYMDHDIIKRNLEKAKSMMEKESDWDRKNRLKVYEAVYLMSVRKFSEAAKLFLETLSTFTAVELLDYNTFIFYTVLMAVVALDRVTLKTKVLQAPEILQVIDQIPNLKSLMNSLYYCNYADFFVALAGISDMMKENRLLRAHAEYYAKEMRIKAYSQLLESYLSVQLDNMAHAFGVSVDFMDRELSRFIASGRLNCKIDKVAGIVETNRPDTKNAQYQNTIKQGDALLNRIQKLSRVINL